MTKFGIVLPQHHDNPKLLVEVARACEQAGLDSVWLSDHLAGVGKLVDRPFLEASCAMAAVASATRTICVGSLVLRAGIRNPALVASIFASLQALAPGRIVAGLGIGDESARSEQLRFGIDFGSVDLRIDALAATASQVRARSPQTPIWIAGNTGGLPELSNIYDGWVFWGTVAEYEATAQRLSRRRVFVSNQLWAGPFPGSEGVAAAVASGATHIAVPVGENSYTRLIDELTACRRRINGAEAAEEE